MLFGTVFFDYFVAFSLLWLIPHSFIVTKFIIDYENERGSNNESK